MGPALKGHESRITALLYDPTSAQVSGPHQQQQQLCCDDVPPAELCAKCLRAASIELPLEAASHAVASMDSKSVQRACQG